MITENRVENGEYRHICLATKILHSKGDLGLLITETDNGFKVVEIGRKQSSLSVRPSSSNSIIIEA